MKTNIKLILFFIYLFLNFCNCQTPAVFGTYEIIKDTYSYNGGCSVVFNVICYIKSSIDTLEKIYLVDSVSLTIYSSQDQNQIEPKYIQQNGSHTFYQFVVYSDSLKSSSSYANPLAFNIVGAQYNFLIYSEEETSNVEYTCNIPPALTVNTNILLPTPIKINNDIIIRIDNLEAPLKTLTVTPQDTNYPFTLNYIKSEKNYVYFNLVFDKTSTTPSFNSMVFECSYGSEGTFNLVLNYPINEIGSNLVTVDSEYPIGSSYITNNNWDINNLVFVNVSGIDSNIFLYSIVSGYASPNLDINQRVRLVTGNYDNGQVLITSSFYPINRYSLDTQPSTISTYLYKETSQLKTITKENNKIEGGLSAITSQNMVNPYNAELYLVDYIFSVDKYPINYNLIVKFGNSDYFKPIYPYGIKSSTSATTQYYFPYSINTLEKGFNILTDIMENQILVGTPSTDTTPPELFEFILYYPREGNGLYAFLRISITDDLSGFDYLYYSGTFITGADITYGDIKSGIFEKKILVNFDTTCYYSDKAGNKVSCQNQDNIYAPFYYRFEPTPLQIPRLVDYNFEFTHFEFESDVYDISEEPRLITVLLNYTLAKEDIPIQFFILDRVYGDKYIDYNSIESRFLMDKSLGLFKITVLIPAKLCSGTIPYLFIINGRKFENEFFFTNFGNKANLNVVSNDCYELPPIITNLEYSTGTSSSNNIATLNDVVTLGWKVRVETKGYLKHAFISAIGDLDRQPYTFLDIEYNYEDKINNVLLDAVWTFRGDRESQVIQLYNVTLLDQRGFKSEFIYNQDIEYINQNKIEEYPAPISPLYKIQDQTLFKFSINSDQFTTVDTIPPQLLSIKSDKQSIDIGNSESILNLNFSTTDNVAISNENRHHPIVYLESSQNFGNFNQSRLECSTTFVDIISNTIDIYNYKAVCRIPYGFGLNGLSISVFGIVDTSFNVIGYTSYDIKTYLPADSNFFILTTFTRLPIIESFILPTSSNNDRLTILGRNLAINPTTTFVEVSYDSYVYQNATILQYSNVGLIVSVSSFSKDFILKVTSDDNESNSIGIPKLIDESSSEQSPNVECLDNCGGPTHGQCIQGIGCRCYSPYSGANCKYESVKIPKPPINTTTPNSLNTFSIENSNVQLSTIVSIVSVRELDIYDNQVNIHNFTNWDYKELSSSSYSYSSSIKKDELNVSNIEVVMEWFDESKSISFANKNFTMNPSSFKYYVNIDKYPFDSVLSNLEIIIKTSFISNETYVCSNRQFGLNDGQDYMTLSIGNYSFEAKFIKLGIADGKTRVLSHRVLSNFTGTDLEPTSNQQYSYIAIQLGHYESSILLDPNFSVLLNPSETSSESNESICSKDSNSNSSSSSSKLTSAQIAGIVVGSVGLITILSLVVLFKLSKSIKCLRLKVILYRIFKR